MSPSLRSSLHSSRRLVREALGWLAVLLSLALMLPGVVATAKAEPRSAGRADGPVCQAAPPPEHAAAGLQRMLEDLKAQAAAANAAHPELVQGGEVVVIDVNGFNYPAVAPPADRQP